MQDNNNNLKVTEAALVEHEAAGHYFSYLEIELLIHTETWSLLDDMSMGERILFISAIVVAIASAITVVVN